MINAPGISAIAETCWWCPEKLSWPQTALPPIISPHCQLSHQSRYVAGVEWTKSTKACCQQPFLPRSVGHGRRNLATFAPSLRRIKPLFPMPIVIKRAKVPVSEIFQAPKICSHIQKPSCWIPAVEFKDKSRRICLAWNIISSYVCLL